MPFATDGFWLMMKSVREKREQPSMSRHGVGGKKSDRCCDVCYLRDHRVAVAQLRLRGVT